ncbi:hypothetical protein JRC04_28675 [Mycolicibacterium sp. S2-37]|nr:hypothetical protein [Mycolicibacterium sp. S2-37]
MLVDADVLRAFADRVGIASNAIQETDLGRTVTSAADGVNGSVTQWAARSVGAHVATLAAQIVQNVASMGTAVRGAGETYEVTDEDLAGSFHGIW